jgi:beta-N-acetylhexosaminidase
MRCKSLILGCAGTTFSADEEAFFSAVKPWGLILFRRNIADPDQILALCARFRALVGRDDAPVLIDQEGGRVQRMGPPLWRRYPAARSYLEATSGDVAKATDLARLGSRLIAHDLKACGITVDCMPVLDCPVEGANDAIGDRAYARDPESLSAIAQGAAEGLLEGGVLPIIKHMPGHGRAMVDSHYALPVVKEDRATLEVSDFLPFRTLSHYPVAMTGHIVFDAIDASHPATTSKAVIENIIRGWIGFDGLLLSDDLSMKALSGDFGQRTAALFAAGCDVALHCNGLMVEAKAVAEAAPDLAGRSLERAVSALSWLDRPQTMLDPVEAGKIIDRVLALQA